MRLNSLAAKLVILIITLMKKIYFEYKITFGYLLIGSLWILFSDKILYFFVAEADTLSQSQTYKGWFFILLTAFLLHSFLKKHLGKLRRAQQRAQESDNLKTAFIQNISHEIRTPMNGIVGFSNLLIKENISFLERRKYSEFVTQSTLQLLTIVEEVLELSLIQVGDVEVKENSVNLNDLLQEIYHINSPQIKKEVILSLENGALDASTSVLIDDDKLKEIFKSLLNNANKFTERGQISFGYTVRGEKLEFFVKDSGVGIPLEVQETIFNSFHKVGKTNKLYDGLGLGLSICKGYLSLLNGSIRVESQPNNGSTFYFTLPFKPQMQVVNTPQTTQAKYNKLTVLVVEDDEINFYYLANILKDIGVKPIRAINGREAVDICMSNKSINFIFMDINMPVMNGYEATKLIRKFNSKVPIIAQTVYGYSNETDDLIRVGCNDFILKPFEIAAVLSVINKYVHLR